MKRGMDLILALTLMVLLSPLALITAIIIKIESKGPVIFKQTRIGENMKPFRVYKFRSMRIHDPKKIFKVHAGQRHKGYKIWKVHEKDKD